MDRLDIEFVKKNKDKVSGIRLESFQKRLEDVKEIKRGRNSKDWSYGDRLETKQFNNGIELHRFYQHQNTLIILQVDWLPPQT